MLRNDVSQLMEAYPRIYFACHTRHVRDPETDQELSAHQASILDHLDDVEPTNVGELALHMDVTPSTMSIAARRLVRQGYVRRERDPDDRRRVLLRLTDAGVRVKSEKSVLDPERVEALLDQLDPGEREDALRGLSLLAEAALRMGRSGDARRKEAS